MRSLTVRLPDRLVTEIEAESRKRSCSKSEVVRERLQRGASPMGNASAGFNLIADLIGSADGLPADLSQRKKSYLKSPPIWQETGSLMLVFWWQYSVPATFTTDGLCGTHLKIHLPGKPVML